VWALVLRTAAPLFRVGNPTHDTGGPRRAIISGCRYQPAFGEIDAMCRLLGYHGEPIMIETLVASPYHSLIKQLQHAAEGKTVANGDGFGVGCCGERTDPGLYRELRPAWSDENL
jgi:hypothetical protein